MNQLGLSGRSIQEQKQTKKRTYGCLLHLCNMHNHPYREQKGPSKRIELYDSIKAKKLLERLLKKTALLIMRPKETTEKKTEEDE